MRKFRRLIYITLGIALLILAAVVLLFLNVIGFSYPSSELLAREYFDAVINRNSQAAANLAGNCGQQIEKQAQEDIKQFGGAETRSLQIIVSENTGGSSETIEIITVNFEYRQPGQSSDWRKGKNFLLSDYTPPGFRHLCVVGG